MKKIGIRPGRPSSIIAVGVSVALVIFGLGFLLVVVNVLAENEAPVAIIIIFCLFMMAWIGAAIAMAIYHGRNIKNNKGGYLLELETDAGNDVAQGQPDPIQQLRALDQLRQDGLINEDEFRRKREELMNRKW